MSWVFGVLIFRLRTPNSELKTLYIFSVSPIEFFEGREFV
jgi:hypothetical protein